MTNQCIKVAGIGAYTPLGRNVEENWRAILAGRTAISQISRFDLGGIACERGGVINLGETGEALALKIVFAALGEALASSGANAGDVGLVIGSNFGDGSESGNAHSAIAAAAKAHFSLGGPVACISLSCSSGSSAAALAAEWIRQGYAKCVAAVGYDILTQTDWAGLCSLRTMARDGVVRPFSADRSGTVFAEGAAAIVLSAPDAPLPDARDAPANLLGWATGNNGFHLTAPSKRGAGSRRVMEDALAMAGADATDIAFVSAHGTGTRANDQTEAEALEDILGAELPHIPVTALKASAGHLLGAAGIFEAAMAIRAIAEKTIPPIAQVPVPDKSLPPLDLVSDTPRTASAGVAVVDSAGFGGCNASLVFGSRQSAEAAGHPAHGGRIAVCSCGFVSALGIGMEEAEAAWAEGESVLVEDGDGVSRGRVPDFNPDEILPAPKAYLDRQCLLALSAAALAMRGVKRGAVPSNRFGTSMGTAFGAYETLSRFRDDCREKGPRLVRPMLFPHTYANAAASLIAIEWELRGHHANFAGGSNASTMAIISAVDALRSGACDAVLAGGAEAFGQLSADTRALDGEGAAVFALTREEDAPAFSDSPPLCFISGAWIGGQDAMASALRDASINVQDISAAYVIPGMVEAVRDTLGACADVRLPSDMFGFLHGASGAASLASAILDGPRGPFVVATNDDSGTVAALVATPCQESRI